MADAQDGGRDERAAYLALTDIPGIGAARLRTLRAAFQTARGVLAAPHGALAALPGFSLAAATAIRALRPESGHRILDALDRLGARVLIPGDSEFPALLEEIPEPPALLYVWGDATLLGRPAVAMVGSRDHTSYGAEAARLLAGGVASAAVVVSGMARGLDAVVHGAALDAGGTSIGVLGNGFGVIYPAANRALYERMLGGNGCLVTEHPPGERPNAGAFPRRNRLISGLARATVVIEAKPDSGAIITADAALEQGRAVLAVPGPITSPTSLGCNRLIQQGAKPALCPRDILEELGLPVPTVSSGEPSVPPTGLNDLQQTLWSALAVEPRHVDALVAAARQETSAVLTALTEMEMRGVVRQEAGMRFALSAEFGVRSAE